MLKWIGVIAFSMLASPLAADEPAATAVPAARPPAVQAPAPVKTGKERLGSKASDEQRVDNCKVPPALRGTTPRPDACERKRETIPTN